MKAELEALPLGKRLLTIPSLQIHTRATVGLELDHSKLILT